MYSIQRQQGIATILIMLLVGISMTALSIGLARNVKSTQQKHIAVHASSHVQPLVWTGVELYRGYLESLDNDALAALKANGKSTKISISKLENSDIDVTAELLTDPVVIPDGEFEYYQVEALIRAFDHSAQASASLKAVYHVAPSGGNNCIECVTLSAMLDFHDDLDIGGQITIKAPTGTQSTFSVDGSVNAINVNLTSINILNSTENIRLSSSTFIDYLYANGTIDLEGSAGTSIAKALGTVTMSGQTLASEVETNVDINLRDSARVTTSMTAQKDIINNGVSNNGSALAGRDILLGASAGRITTGSAKRNIDIGYSNYETDILTAEGNIACPTQTWTRTDGGRAKGSAINCPSGQVRFGFGGGRYPNIQDNQNVTVTLPPPLPPFSMSKPVVDVWQLKGYANYIFTNSGNQINVLVKNIKGIEDGNYILGYYPQTQSRKYLDFLCKEVDGTGKCTNPSDPSDSKTICYGHSINDACLTFNSTTKTFVFNGKSFAPGAMWFTGNLSLGNGTYYNTFIASGNITTSGGHKTSAINYVGYDAICNLNYPENKNTTGDFENLFPTNLCDKTNSKLIYNPIANIALVAGGKGPGGAYSGGNIDIGSSNEINGTILAGKNLLTSGSTIVRGYVSATSQTGRVAGLADNKLGASTQILLNNLPAGYNPEMIPPMTVSQDNEDRAGKGLSKLVWARHL